MNSLLEAINRGILKGLNENNIELLADLDDDTADQLDTLQSKSFNNDKSLRFQLLIAIKTKKIHTQLKDAINNPKNYYKFNSLIKAKNTEHLKELIEIGQQLFGDDGNFNWIDTSEITDMSRLFYDSYFNGHIGLWDVSNVTDMTMMFCHATKFNQPIGDWDVSNVTDMSYMFCVAKKFNQPIGDWDVNSVTNMYGMFYEARSFNQPIGDWNVSNVTDMRQMFCCAYKFNQLIGDWNVSNVTDMENMFFCAREFNQPLNTWNVSKVRLAKYMFSVCPIKEEYKPKFIK